MGPHKFFVRILDKEQRNFVQEVDPKMFTWLQQLRTMDATINEPNLLKLERYPDSGLYQPTGQIEAFYAGVARMSDDSLVIQYHYYVNVRPTKLRGHKKKPFLISDYGRILTQKTQNGDSRNPQ